LNWRNQLPRQRGSHLPDYLLAILKMSPEAYRRELRSQGFGDDYIDRELAELARARKRGLIPGPAEPASPAPPPDAGAFEFLLRRRKARQHRTKDTED